MLKLGIRLARTALKTADHVKTQAADAVGLGDQVEGLQDSIASLPGVEDVVRIAKVAADQWAPERLPLYKPDAGEHEVMTLQQDFVDPVRGRPIPMKVYCPKDMEGKAPVVVLSHGLAGNSFTYRYLGRHLASHGYIVAQPTHVGSDTAAVMKKTPVLAFTQGELIDRTKDVSFTLDQLEKDGGFPEELKEHADLSRVAVAGHSFGALTAETMAGVATKDSDGNQLPTQDDRVDAFVAMSPFGDSFPTHLLGMDVNTYGEVQKPILYMSGENDSIFTLGKGARAHSSAFAETGSQDKYNLVMEGGGHVDFAQVFGVEDKSVADLTKTTTLAFLDAHLKSEKPARNYLKDLPEVARTHDSWADVNTCS